MRFPGPMPYPIHRTCRSPPFCQSPQRGGLVVGAAHAVPSSPLAEGAWWNGRDRPFQGANPRQGGVILWGAVIHRSCPWLPHAALCEGSGSALGASAVEDHRIPRAPRQSHGWRCARPRARSPERATGTHAPTSSPAAMLRGLGGQESHAHRVPGHPTGGEMPRLLWAASCRGVGLGQTAARFGNSPTSSMPRSGFGDGLGGGAGGAFLDGNGPGTGGEVAG